MVSWVKCSFLDMFRQDVTDIDYFSYFSAFSGLLNISANGPISTPPTASCVAVSCSFSGNIVHGATLPTRVLPKGREYVPLTLIKID